MEQARRDSRQDELPAVFHKKNNADILVTMTLDDWMQIYREYEAGNYIKMGEINGKTYKGRT